MRWFWPIQTSAPCMLCICCTLFFLEPLRGGETRQRPPARGGERSSSSSPGPGTSTWSRVRRASATRNGLDWHGCGWVHAHKGPGGRSFHCVPPVPPSLPPITHHTHATACGSTACRMTKSAVCKTRWQYLKHNRRTRSLHGNHLPAITVEELERHVDYHHVSIERTMVEQARARHTLCRSVYQKS